MQGAPDTRTFDGDDAGGQLFITVAPDTSTETNDDLSVVFDRSRRHLFETASGDALTDGLVDVASAMGATVRKHILTTP